MAKLENTKKIVENNSFLNHYSQCLMSDKLQQLLKVVGAFVDSFNEDSISGHNVSISKTIQLS